MKYTKLLVATAALALVAGCNDKDKPKMAIKPPLAMQPDLTTLNSFAKTEGSTKPLTQTLQDNELAAGFGIGPNGLRSVSSKGNNGNGNTRGIIVNIDGTDYVFNDGSSVSTDGMQTIGNGIGGAYQGSFTTTDSNGALSVNIDGLETPAAELPTSVVNYKGTYAVGPDANNTTSGTFDAAADFGAAQSISGKLDTNATISGDISGSRFTGVIDAGADGSLGMAGAFYGPNAGEIGGVASGTLGGQDVKAVFGGVRQ